MYYRNRQIRRRKIVATVVFLGMVIGCIIVAIWNPFVALLLVLPVVTIIAVIMRGMTDIWRS